VIPLPAAFYERPTVIVAQDLIGCVLTCRIGCQTTSGRIVETEAYGPDDPASHAYRGRTPRNDRMFGAPGRAYVYRSYGVHWCLNAVTRPEGVGEAVLIRALEPLSGAEHMRLRRSGASDRVLCAGPGRLSQAMGICGCLDGAPLTGAPASALSITGPAPWPWTPSVARPEVVSSPRIGISVATDRLWRFTEAGSRYLSRGSRSLATVGP
jgi:DNA-3-methyladenine glycosylase